MKFSLKRSIFVGVLLAIFALSIISNFYSYELNDFGLLLGSSSIVILVFCVIQIVNIIRNKKFDLYSRTLSMILSILTLGFLLWYSFALLQDAGGINCVFIVSGVSCTTYAQIATTAVLNPFILMIIAAVSVPAIVMSIKPRK